MRKITKETARAFYNMQTCKKSNVVVDYGVNHHMYYFLHNNLIGDYNPKKRRIDNYGRLMANKHNKRKIKLNFGRFLNK